MHWELIPKLQQLQQQSACQLQAVVKLITPQEVIQQSVQQTPVAMH